jgi:pimeloyl-ACP methyl ester carboxylesterase
MLERAHPTSLLPRSLLPALLAALGGLIGSQALAEGPTTFAAHTEGAGTTTIVLLSGLGDTLDVWRQVQPAMAANCARTFAYTRAGYDGSSPASGPRDAATIVAELRAELQRRLISPPYVVVGHSLGGLYAQYFARQFPSEVSGLLLIDSTHWHQQLPSTLGATPAHESQGIFLYMPIIMRRELAGQHAGRRTRCTPVPPPATFRQSCSRAPGLCAVRHRTQACWSPRCSGKLPQTFRPQRTRTSRTAATTFNAISRRWSSTRHGGSRAAHPSKP